MLLDILTIGGSAYPNDCRRKRIPQGSQHGQATLQIFVFGITGSESGDDFARHQKRSLDHDRQLAYSCPNATCEIVIFDSGRNIKGWRIAEIAKAPASVECQNFIMGTILFSRAQMRESETIAVDPAYMWPSETEDYCPLKSPARFNNERAPGSTV